MQMLSGYENLDLQRALRQRWQVARSFDAYVFGSGHLVTACGGGRRHANAADCRLAQADSGSTTAPACTKAPSPLKSSTTGAARSSTHALAETLIVSTSRPSHIAIDPDGDLLATFDVAADMLRHQLSTARQHAYAGRRQLLYPSSTTSRALSAPPSAGNRSFGCARSSAFAWEIEAREPSMRSRRTSASHQYAAVVRAWKPDGSR